MKEGVQIKILRMGKFGCYSIVLAEIAMRYLGIKDQDADAYLIPLTNKAINAGHIELSDTHWYWIKDRHKALGSMTGLPWNSKEVPKEYKLQPGESEIDEWRLDRFDVGGKKINPDTHFVLGDGFGGVHWDPARTSAGLSYVVKQGYLHKRVVFWVEGA